MILSDRDIIAAINNKDIIMRNPDGRDLLSNNLPQDGFALEAMAIDLRVNRVRNYRTGTWIEWGQDPIYWLKPNDLVIVETYEYMAFGNLLAGTLHPRARQSLLGAIGISTTIHPGWPGSQQGNITPAPLWIAVYNHGPGKLPLRYKDCFCRMLIHQVSSEPLKKAPTQQDIFGDADKLIKEQQKRIRGRLIFRRRSVRVASVAIIVALATLLILSPVVPDSLKTLVTAIVAAISAAIVTYLLTL